MATKEAIGVSVLLASVLMLAGGASAWKANDIELGKTYHKTASQTEDASLFATLDVSEGDNVTVSVWNATQSGSGSTNPVVYFRPPDGVWNDTGGTNHIAVWETSEQVECDLKFIPFVGTGTCWLVVAADGVLTITFDIATPATGSVSVDLNVTAVRAPAPADGLDELWAELQNISDALNATKQKLDNLNLSSANQSDIDYLQQTLENLTIDLVNVTDRLQNITNENGTTVVWNNSTVFRNVTTNQTIWRNETVELNKTVVQKIFNNVTNNKTVRESYNDAELRYALHVVNGTVKNLTEENGKLKADLAALEDNSTGKSAASPPGPGPASGLIAGAAAGTAAGAAAGVATGARGAVRFVRMREESAAMRSAVDLDEKVKP